ncbi:uncharacterized protein LOC111031829 [Myzus persicae]|uniref:uncharacterized protein LOC111031829 n=1 Tax=Myzus persicae TaxID=13164 RepID=UPI000B931228|nr:uncharacterized protein LOC111031829 [Myzus persicae]XP_022167627.1 uncharacterized protein LOC111031829 [Myzus persicae]XP_022167628.1 uncharacterized protein LOC111031829 [Myzus persicae]
MAAEDSKKYCFGFIDLRRGIKIIALLNISVLFLAVVLNIIFLVMVLGEKYRIPSSSNSTEEIKNYRINTIHGLCASSFLEIILLYFNLGLKKSIHEQNVQNIKHWLLLYTMVLLHIFIYYISAAFVSDEPLFFSCIGLISSLIILLMLYVVKRFYREELEHLAPSNTTEDNNVTPSQTA